MRNAVRSIPLFALFALPCACSSTPSESPIESIGHTSEAIDYGTCTYDVAVGSRGGLSPVWTYTGNACPPGQACSASDPNGTNCTWSGGPGVINHAVCTCADIPTSCGDLRAIIVQLGAPSFADRQAASNALAACCTTPEQLAALQAAAAEPPPIAWPPGGELEGRTRLARAISACTMHLDNCNGSGVIGFVDCTCVYDTTGNLVAGIDGGPFPLATQCDGGLDAMTLCPPTCSTKSTDTTYVVPMRVPMCVPLPVPTTTP
jgi:hypothetical protein